MSYNFSTGHEIDDDNLSDIIKNENSEIWNGKVGVIRASEYLRANSNKNCETFSLNNNNYNACRGTNWMYDSTNWWTLNAAGGSMKVYYVFSNGKIYFEDYNIMNSYNVRPVVYLSSSVKITDGDGSKSNPFIIE